MLFKDVNTIAEYAEVVSAVNFFSLKATLRNVEEQHLIPIIGKTLYTSLNAAYSAAADEAAAQVALSSAEKLLLDRCRLFIGPYLAYYHAPKTEVKLSDAGVRREETNTSKTAYQYQVKNFRQACLQEAEAQSELLLQFLEDNNAGYPTWVSDSAFSAYRSLFIKTGREFGELVPSHSPYKNYWAMRSKMKDIEEQYIRLLLGDDLYAYLKTKALAATPVFSSRETDLIFYLKKAIANFTMSFSIPFLNVKIDANGLSVMAAGISATDDETASRAAPSGNDISHIIRAGTAAGKEWIQTAKNYLEKYHTDFPLYNYTAPQTVSANCTNHGGAFGLT